MTFQSIPNSDANTTRSSNEGQTTPNLELSKEEVFESNLTQLFTKSLLAVPKTKNAVLREDRYCILQNDEQTYKVVNPYMLSCWHSLHVWSRFVAMTNGDDSRIDTRSTSSSYPFRKLGHDFSKPLQILAIHAHRDSKQGCQVQVLYKDW